MLITLKNKWSPRSLKLDECLRSFGLFNPFNPSIVEHDGNIFVAFRGARDSKDRPFRAYLTVIDQTYSELKLLDLSAHLAHLGLPSINDPKLFRLGDDVWVSINTGHHERPNRIFVMKIHPARSEPIECRFEQRDAIEKNWGFYLSGGTLCCLYGLNPLVLLQCDDHHAGTWEFRQRPRWSLPFDAARPALTIGPQPVLVQHAEGPRLRLIAHQKFVALGKRAYLGRAVEIALGDAPRLASVGPLLSHSWLSMLGARVRHNRNLISCTYFSGLSLAGGRALIGYGINDTNFAFADAAPNEIGFPSELAA